MRRSLLLSTLAFLLLLPVGCSTLQRRQLYDSGSAIVRHARDIAERTVYSVAQSEFDLFLKEGFTMSWGRALHTIQTTLTQESIKEIPAVIAELREDWLPDKPHWTNLSVATAELIQKEIKIRNATTREQIDQVIEEVIAGLQLPAPVAPSPTPHPSPTPIREPADFGVDPSK